MKRHARDERTRQAVCGVFGYTAVTDDVALVDCKHCLRRLGLEVAPRWCTPAELALIAAVAGWHDSYLAVGAVAGVNREGALCAAWDIYERDVERRRHYTG